MNLTKCDLSQSIAILLLDNQDFSVFDLVRPSSSWLLLVQMMLGVWENFIFLHGKISQAYLVYFLSQIQNQPYLRNKELFQLKMILETTTWSLGWLLSFLLKANKKDFLNAIMSSHQYFPPHSIFQDCSLTSLNLCLSTSCSIQKNPNF